MTNNAPSCQTTRYTWSCNFTDSDVFGPDALIWAYSMDDFDLAIDFSWSAGNTSNYKFGSNYLPSPKRAFFAYNQFYAISRAGVATYDRTGQLITSYQSGGIDASSYVRTTATNGSSNPREILFVACGVYGVKAFEITGGALTLLGTWLPNDYIVAAFKENSTENSIAVIGSNTHTMYQLSYVLISSSISITVVDTHSIGGVLGPVTITSGGILYSFGKTYVFIFILGEHITGAYYPPGPAPASLNSERPKTYNVTAIALFNDDRLMVGVEKVGLCLVDFSQARSKIADTLDRVYIDGRIINIQMVTQYAAVVCTELEIHLFLVHTNSLSLSNSFSIMDNFNQVYDFTVIGSTIIVWGDDEEGSNNFLVVRLSQRFHGQGSLHARDPNNPSSNVIYLLGNDGTTTKSVSLLLRQPSSLRSDIVVLAIVLISAITGALLLVLLRRLC